MQYTGVNGSRAEGLYCHSLTASKQFLTFGVYIPYIKFVLIFTANVMQTTFTMC